MKELGGLKVGSAVIANAIPQAGYEVIANATPQAGCAVIVNAMTQTPNPIHMI